MKFKLEEQDSPVFSVLASLSIDDRTILYFVATKYRQGNEVSLGSIYGVKPGSTQNIGYFNPPVHDLTEKFKFGWEPILYNDIFYTLTTREDGLGLYLSVTHKTQGRQIPIEYIEIAITKLELKLMYNLHQKRSKELRI